VAYAGLLLISKAALTTGMSYFVLVVYRHVIATVVLGPLAYFLERRSRPSITIYSFSMISLLALCGTTIQQNMFFAGIKYTSPIFASAVGNTLPGMTFLMAVLLRMEKARIKTVAGKSKVLGTMICISGALVVTLYKGPAIPMLFFPPVHMKLHPHQHHNLNKDWIKGSILLSTSQIARCTWIIFQAKITKIYPAQMSLVALMCFSASLQSVVVGFIFERNPAAWALGWNLQLFTVIYTGIVISGAVYCLQMWSINKRGPVFVAMFSPVTLMVVAVLSPILLDERLHLGSIIGGILIIIGLYTVLWAKREDLQDVGNLLPIETPETTSNEVQEAGCITKSG
ncbi:hypothetical protein KI387_018735, partial [Taxus chinensis]